jgi:hypothetical protein
MTARACVVLATASLLPGPSAAQDRTVPRGAVAPNGYTKVTGNDLPHWRVWRAAFRGLARPNNRDTGESNWLPHSIEVVPDQLALILAAAARSAAAEREMVERQQQTLAVMQAAEKTWTDIKPVLYELDYGQRVTTLRERDALLEQLTPEARSALETRIQELRDGAESFVPTTDLDDWRRPS